MKSIRLIFVSLCAITLLMMQSCAKEQWGADDRSDAIAQPAVPSGADGEEAVNPTEDEGSGTGDNDGNGGGSENGGESTTPVEKPEFIDNHDWSAYDENEYLIGFGAMDENSQKEGEKVAINLSSLAVTWKGGEEVTVYVPATNKSGTYFYDKTREQFRPNSPEDILAVGDNLAYVYYPADLFKSFDRSTGKATVTMPSAVTANTLASLAAKLPMSGIIPSEQGKAYPTVTFRNLCSVMRVQLTGWETVKSVQLSNSNIALTGDGLVSWDKDASDAIPSLVTSGGSTSVTIFCEAGGITLDKDTAREFYFLLPPSAATMNEMTVTVTFSQKDDDNYTYEPYITKTRNGNMTLARNKIVKLAFRAGFFSGGDGSQATPYQIANATDLRALATCCGASSKTPQYGYNSTADRNYFRSPIYYRQTANIDLSAGTVPVVGSASFNFMGTYDGNSKTLSNGSISANTSVNIAPFGYLNGGTVKNLTVSGLSVTQTGNDNTTYLAAGVVGYLTGNGTVSGCKLISSTVIGPRAGGIVGNVDNGSVTDCRVQKGTITTTDGFAGGVVGSIKTGSISGCYCWGANSAGGGDASSVSGTTLVGGIVGVLGADSGTASVSGCYVSNTGVTASEDFAGGVAGRVYSGGSINGMTTSATVSNACGAISVSADRFAGGVAGSNAGTITGATADADPKLWGLTYNATVSAKITTAGGVVGENTGTITDAYASYTSVTAPTIVGGIAGSSSGSVVKAISRNCTIRAINASSTYGNNAGGIVGSMGSDGSINLSALPATSGNGNTIEGAYNVGGVCGTMSSGTTITGSTTIAACSGATMTGSENNVAAVVGRCSGNITNCIVDGTNSVSGVWGVGGIAGYVADGSGTITISGCKVQGKQTYTASDANLAGVAGSIATASTISNCQVSGTQKFTARNYVGGIIGLAGAQASVTGCTVSGLSFTVTDSNNGGVIGGAGADDSTYTITVSNCSVSGTVNTGTSTVGGIVGYGKTTNLSITDCTNTAAITGTGNVGGILGAGMAVSMDKCRSTGAVTGSGDDVGGLVGEFTGGTITRSYSKGTVKGSSNAGGLVGYVNSNKGRVVIMNANARSTVITTGTSASPVGGLVGSLYSNGKMAILANCVAWDKVVKNTNKSNANTPYVGALVGKLNSSNNKSDAVLQNCYVQAADINLGVGDNNTELPTTTTGTYIGGIYGRAVKGTIKDCYYRCTQTGSKATDNVDGSATSMTQDVKNGTVTANWTLSNGRSPEGKYLYQALTLGSYTGGSGTTSASYDTMGGGTATFSTWTTYDYDSGSDPVLHFALPTVLSTLGTDYYL